MLRMRYHKMWLGIEVELDSATGVVEQNRNLILAKKRAILVCDVCGGNRLSGTHDFISFHCLLFCSPDCYEEYRTEDEERAWTPSADRYLANPTYELLGAFELAGDCRAPGRNLFSA